MTVTARLVPTKGGSPALPATPPAQPSAPNSEGSIVITLGNSRYLITHLREGVQMHHTQQEWQHICGAQLTDLVAQLKADNAGFNPDEASEMEISLASRTVTYTSAGAAPQPLAVRSAQRALHQLARAIHQTATKSPLPPNTIAASSSQATAPGADIAIALEFAQTSLRTRNRERVFTRKDLDSIISSGHKKFAAIPKRMRDAHSRFPDGMATGKYPELELGRTKSYALLDDDQNAEILEGILTTLCDSRSDQDVFCGFTCSNKQSFGLTIYKNKLGNAEKIVYFDAHNHAANGTQNACIKTFDTILQAAQFLATRIPNGKYPKNTFTVTAFYQQAEDASDSEPVGELD